MRILQCTVVSCKKKYFLKSYTHLIKNMWASWWKALNFIGYGDISLKRHCTRVFLARYPSGNRSQLPSSFYIFTISLWFITDEWSRWEDFYLKNRHLMPLSATTVIPLVQSFQLYGRCRCTSSVCTPPWPTGLGGKKSQIVTCVRVITTRSPLPLNVTGQIGFNLSASLQLVCVFHQCSTEGWAKGPPHILSSVL